MKPRVYLETSVVSYLVGRRSRDVVVLGNQELASEWRASRRVEYDLFISEIVIGEAGIGAPESARQRLRIAEDLFLVGLTEEAERLAPLLLKAAGLAANAETDALHMAVAAVHGNGLPSFMELQSHRQYHHSARDRKTVQSIRL